MRELNIAVVGATGMVGRTFLKVLTEKDNIKIKNLYFYASSKSAGLSVECKNKEYKVIELNEENIKNKKIDYALFSAGGKISLEYAPIFKKYGAIVIDNSSAFRMEKDVPLVVPQVNKKACFKHNGIIANPNCSTIQCMLPLKALNDKFKLKKVDYVTFQAVSGSGMKGKLDLERTSKGLSPEFYPYPIYNNCLPHIDTFLENGYTKEEMKMVNETRKILELPKLKVTATCVRVPVENSHSIEIHAQLKKNFKMEDVYSCLNNFENIKVVDDPKNNLYPICTMATGNDYVYVGRIRRDLFNKKAIHIFCVADNIRKGAASNAIEILELLERGL